MKVSIVCLDRNMVVDLDRYLYCEGKSMMRLLSVNGGVKDAKTLGCPR